MGTIVSSRRRGALAVTLSLLTALGVLAAVPASPAAAYDPGHTIFKGAVDAGDPGMGQANGAVLTLESANGVVWAGGNFTSTRPAGATAGQQETGQGFLAAYDERSGAPLTDFAPRLSFQCEGEDCPNVEAPVARATALSPDGNTLYVGGDFNRVDGEVVNYLARFDTRTGALLDPFGTFKQGVDGPVHALAVSPDSGTLYVGGTFTRARAEERRYVAAFDVATGRATDFAPRISEKLWDKENVRVVSLGVSGDGQNVLIGGTFGRSNGRAVQGFTAVSAATGKNLQGSWKQAYLRGNRTWATVIQTGGDGSIFVGARSDSRGPDKSRTEGVFRLDDSTGAITWYAQCYGDTYAIQPLGNDVYVGSHAHNCEGAGGMPEQRPRVRLAVHALNRATGVVRPYFVQTNGSADPERLLSRAFAVDPGQTQLVMGGGYGTVNGTPQSNLVRFARGSARPSRAAFPTATTCRRCASTRVSFTTGFDRDDIDLRYTVFRRVGGSTKQIRTVRRQSFFYERSTATFRDKGVKRGQKVAYRVRVSDPAGNQLMSVWTKTLTVGKP